MAEFSKSEKKLLRELAGVIHETDARLTLDELDAEFTRWHDGELLGLDLIAAIHEFDQKDARALWSVYQALKDPDIVARGLALGLIGADAVPEQLRVKLKPLTRGFGRT